MPDHGAALLEKRPRFCQGAIGDDLHRRHDEHLVGLGPQLQCLARDTHVVFEHLVGQPVAIVERVLQTLTDLLERDVLAGLHALA